MYTFHPTTNMIEIDPYKGMQIKRLSNDSSGEWTNGDLVISDMGKINNFTVSLCVNDKDPKYPIKIRPAKKYDSYTFEQFFGFGCHCDGYSTKTTIGVLVQERTIVV